MTLAKSSSPGIGWTRSILRSPGDGMPRVGHLSVQSSRYFEPCELVPLTPIHSDLFRFIVILGPTSSTIDMCTFCLGWFYYGIRTTSNPAAVAKFHTHWFLQGFVSCLSLSTPN